MGSVIFFLSRHLLQLQLSSAQALRAQLSMSLEASVHPSPSWTREARPALPARGFQKPDVSECWCACLTQASVLSYSTGIESVTPRDILLASGFSTESTSCFLYNYRDAMGYVQTFYQRTKDLGKYQITKDPGKLQNVGSICVLQRFAFLPPSNTTCSSDAYSRVYPVTDVLSLASLDECSRLVGLFDREHSIRNKYIMEALED